VTQFITGKNLWKEAMKNKTLNKKAQTNEVYHILIQILIAITIYWILQSYIDSVAKDTLFEKSYLSKDLALLIDTIYGGPGEIKYLYFNDKAGLNKFEFDFSSQKVKVDEVDSKEKLTVEHPYGEDLSLHIIGQKIRNLNQIDFSKTENNLEVSQNLK